MPFMEPNEKVTLQKLKAELEKMRAEYEQKLAGMGASAPVATRVQDENEQRLHEMIKNQEEWLNEYVEVKLFRDNDKYRDDVYVAINGKNCVIRRGEWTRIRRKFALLLDQSEIQDLRTAEMMSQESARFASDSRARGL